MQQHLTQFKKQRLQVKQDKVAEAYLKLKAAYISLMYINYKKGTPLDNDTRELLREYYEAGAKLLKIFKTGKHRFQGEALSELLTWQMYYNSGKFSAIGIDSSKNTSWKESTK